MQLSGRCQYSANGTYNCAELYELFADKRKKKKQKTRKLKKRHRLRSDDTSDDDNGTTEVEVNKQLLEICTDDPVEVESHRLPPKGQYLKMQEACDNARPRLYFMEGDGVSVRYFPSRMTFNKKNEKGQVVEKTSCTYKYESIAEIPEGSWLVYPFNFFPDKLDAAPRTSCKWQEYGRKVSADLKNDIKRVQIFGKQ